MSILIVATTDGLQLCEAGSQGWQPRVHGLQGHHVTSVIAREGVILAGTTDGIYRSDDLGQTWQEASQGVAHRHVRWLAFHPDISDFEVAGTEPAAIFISRDGGETWRECPEVAHLREEHDWSLPYSPEAGCVRGFALHGSRAYAAVEVGGVLRSDDGGVHWALLPSAPHPDVHSVSVHPESPELLFAATYAGLYRSADGGASWTRLYEDCYCRAFWVDPADPAHIIFAPATRRGWHGSITETRDGGQRWLPADQGLDTPWDDTLVERFAQVGDELFAVLADGRLLAAPLATLAWQHLLPGLARVNAVTGMA